MKTVIVSAIWKRPEIFKLFAKGVHELKKQYDIECVVAGSEGNTSRELVQCEGFRYVEAPNDPLAKKHNMAVREARRMRPDYLLMMGSDDIVTPEAFEVYLEAAKKKIDFIGVTDFYFWDYQSKKASYWGGYIDQRKGHTAGAGRMISASLMGKWGWQPFENKHSKILDDSIQQKLKNTRHKAHTFSLKANGVVAVDIKSDVNMTPFELWPNTEYIDSKILTDKIPCLNGHYTT